MASLMSPEERELFEKAALKYDLNALRKQVERRKDNIKIFQKAIDDEMAGIVNDQNMIAILETRNGV